MKIHELKTDPDSFDESWRGHKHWEIRFNDRGYRVGDSLVLRETNFTGEEMRKGKPLVYTGRRMLVEVVFIEVVFIIAGPIYGLQDGWVIMSTDELERMSV